MSNEMRHARALIKGALELGYSVSVFDGELWPVKRSRSEAEIMEHVDGYAEELGLRLRDADGEFVGNIHIVWGNDPDGSEFVSDCSDNPATLALVDGIHERLYG